MFAGEEDKYREAIAEQYMASFCKKVVKEGFMQIFDKLFWFECPRICF